MSLEDPGAASFAGIGGLGEQVRELREVIELPLMNPELFEVCYQRRCRVLELNCSASCSVWESSLRRVSFFTVPPVQVCQGFQLFSL
jgi:hypothetical protein